MFDSARSPPRPNAQWGLVLLGLGGALWGTSYFGNANPLFLGHLTGIDAGAALVGVGAVLLAWNRGTARR